MCVLFLKNSNVIIWLSQFDDIEKFPINVKKKIGKEFVHHLGFLKELEI